MYFVKGMKREDVPLASFVIPTFYSQTFEVLIFSKKQLAIFFSKSKENTNLFFLIHVLNKVQSLFLLPRNFSKQKNILYVGSGVKRQIIQF